MDQQFSYYPFGRTDEAGHELHPTVLSGSLAVANRLRYLASCQDGYKCSVQEKGHLLHALDAYYWGQDNGTPATVRETAHQLRYYAALASAANRPMAPRPLPTPSSGARRSDGRFPPAAIKCRDQVFNCLRNGLRGGRLRADSAAVLSVGESADGLTSADGIGDCGREGSVC